jgi:hypothetical protein
MYPLPSFSRSCQGTHQHQPDRTSAHQAPIMHRRASTGMRMTATRTDQATQAEAPGTRATRVSSSRWLADIRRSLGSDCTMPQLCEAIRNAAQACRPADLPPPEADDAAWLVATVASAAESTPSRHTRWGTQLISLGNAMSAMAADFPEHGQSIACSAARLLDMLTQADLTASSGGLAEFMYALRKLGDCPAAGEFIRASLPHLNRISRILVRQACIMLYGVREQQNSSDIESLTEILTWKTDMKDGLEVKYLAKLALSLRDRPSRSAKLAWQSILGRQFLKTRPTAYIDIVKVLMGCFPTDTASLPAQTRALLRALATCLPEHAPQSRALACRMLAEATLLLAPHSADEDARALMTKLAVKMGMPEHAADIATATAADGPQLAYRMLGGDNFFDTALDLHNCSAQLATTVVEQCLAKMNHDNSSLQIITGTGRAHPGKEGKMLDLVEQVARRYPVRLLKDRWSAAIVEVSFHPWRFKSVQDAGTGPALKRKAQDYERPDAAKKPRLSPDLEQKRIASEHDMDGVRQLDLDVELSNRAKNTVKLVLPMT